MILLAPLKIFRLTNIIHVPCLWIFQNISTSLWRSLIIAGACRVRKFAIIANTFRGWPIGEIGKPFVRRDPDSQADRCTSNATNNRASDCSGRTASRTYSTTCCCTFNATANWIYTRHMPGRVGMPHRIIVDVRVPIEFLRVLRPRRVLLPKQRCSSRIARPEGERAGARDNRIRRDEARQHQIVRARMIVQQTGAVPPLPGVVQRRLADAAAADAAPRVEVLPTHHRAAAARRHAPAAEVGGVGGSRVTSTYTLEVM